MNHEENWKGHLAALVTILIWGTTFISTKVLLQNLWPIEILFLRFMIGFIVLFLLDPRPINSHSFRKQATFAAAGLCGVTLYYLLENIALTYTTASNVGVIISVAPFFTAWMAQVFNQQKAAMSRYFILGFILALVGIGMINWGGSQLKLNPVGDLLALGAAIVWAVYSNLSKKVNEMGYSTIQSTRRAFGYGLIFMLPALKGMGFRFRWAQWIQPTVGLNLLFLGLGASALCFVTWNKAVAKLGAVKTSIYIYLVPIITIMTSTLILKETITSCLVIGTVLTLMGLLISNRNEKVLKRIKKEKISVKRSLFQ